MSELLSIELVGATQRELEHFYGELPEDFSLAFSFSYANAEVIGESTIGAILLEASWPNGDFKQSLTLNFEELTADSLGEFLRAVPYRDVDFEPILLVDFEEGELKVRLESAFLSVGPQEKIDTLWDSGDRVKQEPIHRADTNHRKENRP